MKRSIAAAWLLATAALAGAAAWLGSAVAAPGPVRQRWEYHCALPPGVTPGKVDTADEHGETSHHPSEKVLNHLGDQGWELVTIDPQNGHYCFKRGL